MWNEVGTKEEIYIRYGHEADIGYEEFARIYTSGHLSQQNATSMLLFENI